MLLAIIQALNWLGSTTAHRLQFYNEFLGTTLTCTVEVHTASAAPISSSDFIVAVVVVLVVGLISSRFDADYI